MIILGLSIIALVIVLVIVLLIIALTIVIKKLNKQVKHVINEKIKKTEIMLRNKDQFLRFLQKLADQILKVIQEINPKILTQELLTKKSTHELIESIEKLKQILSCIHYDGIKNLLSDGPVRMPPILAEIISEKVKLMCKEQQMDYDSLIQCFDFYEGDREVDKARKQFEKKVEAIVDQRINEYLPPIPSQLTKPRLMKILKLRTIKNYERTIKKTMSKPTFSSIQIPCKVQQQYQTKVSNIYMNVSELKNSDQNQTQLQVYNAAICRNWNDDAFIKQYHQFQAKSEQIKQMYENCQKEGQGIQYALKQLMKCI